jgi:hypothetical protein
MVKFQCVGFFSCLVLDKNGWRYGLCESKHGKNKIRGKDFYRLLKKSNSRLSG